MKFEEIKDERVLKEYLNDMKNRLKDRKYIFHFLFPNPFKQALNQHFMRKNSNMYTLSYHYKNKLYNLPQKSIIILIFNISTEGFSDEGQTKI